MRRAVVLVPLLLMACMSSGPEARVKQAFDACVKGVESGDAGAVIERLDPAFSGPDGMDRSAAKLYLMAVLRREKVGVTIFSNRLEARDRQVFQTVELLLTSRSGGGLLPQDASRRTLLLRWEESKGDWRLREILDQTGGLSPQP